MKALKLNSRNVIRISGPDTAHLLQGLITADLKRCLTGETIYSALLTPQGKYLFDFFIFLDGNAYLLDCEAARSDELIRKLTFYKLRADVLIEDASGEWDVWAFNEVPAGDLKSYLDPRTPEIGYRGFIPKDKKLEETRSIEDYEDHRLTLGLPDGARDMEVDKRFILEANFKELNGVDFDKGCYIGQEMTARMTYRGSLKKRLFPVTIEGPLPTEGSPVMCGDREAGHFRSGQGERAIALVRVEFLDKDLTTVAGDKVTVIRPDWMKQA